MSEPVFYETKQAGLSTEAAYFESDGDLRRSLRASETDRTSQAAVIREVVADRNSWIGNFKRLEADRDMWIDRFRELEADRDAWVGYFKELEADRDAWVARYELIRSQIIAYEDDAPSRTVLVRQLSAERDAAEVSRRGINGVTEPERSGGASCG